MFVPTHLSLHKPNDRTTQTHTQNHITMHRAKKQNKRNNNSSIQCGQIDLLFHSQLSQAAHCSHNLKTERECAACFWMYVLVPTHLRRTNRNEKKKGNPNSYYGITFKNRTSKPHVPFLKQGGNPPTILHLT